MLKSIYDFTIGFVILVAVEIGAALGMEVADE